MPSKFPMERTAPPGRARKPSIPCRTSIVASIDRCGAERECARSLWIRRCFRFVAWQLQCANQIAQPIDLCGVKPCRESIDDFVRRGWINEQRGADAHGRRTGEDEFGGVLPGLDAA